MKLKQDSRLYVFGGVAGISGTLCYILAALVPMGQTPTFVLAMAWPVLSIIFVFSLYHFVSIKGQSPANQLAFLFAAIAFTMVAVMISIQLGVRSGMEEYIAGSPEKEDALKLMRRSMRLVDMGLDVAWDFFIGIALIFLCAAFARDDQFGFRWGVPAALLGVLVIALNVTTFPWPPNTRGLFDIGPAIGLYIIALSFRLLMLGIRLN